MLCVKSFGKGHESNKSELFYAVAVTELLAANIAW